jgi:hypothetical protein
MNAVFLIAQVTLTLDERIAHKLELWLDEQQGFQTWEAFGSAAGGFVAVLLYFGFRYWIAARRSKPVHIRRYLVANSLNTEPNRGLAGEIWHGCGKRVNDHERLKRIKAAQSVWEFCWDELVEGKTHKPIFCGPDASDYASPGKFAAIFRLKAENIPNHQKTGYDPLILELDVAKWTTSYVTSERTGLSDFNRKNDLVVRRFVRISELKEDEWVDFALEFYADGIGSWEYRVWPYDGTISERPNPFTSLNGESSLRIYFDSVTLESRPQMSIPDL